MWVEFKCPICGGALDDDKSMANFMICNESSHGTLRFFTGDGCFFTSNAKVAEELVKKGKTCSCGRSEGVFRQTRLSRKGRDIESSVVSVALDPYRPTLQPCILRNN